MDGHLTSTPPIFPLLPFPSPPSLHRVVAFPLSTTAIVYGMTIVTGKLADFEATGTALVDSCAET